MTQEADVPSHSCGRVVDYCQYQDTKIFFCIFCKKVTGAAKEEQITFTVNIDSDLEIDEYSQETLQENV